MKIFGLILLAASVGLAAQTAPKPQVSKAKPAASAVAQTQDWRTPAEISDYRTTPRYDETLSYIRRVAAAASKQVKIETFGKTGEGRDLVAVIVSRDGQFDPAALHQANRPIVLIQNAIHAGEMDGKDACLALLRDTLITKEKAALLDRVVLVIIPIYNADGHERFSPYNRINQNGPEQMGWRTTARNLNLNRDYLKADAPETRAFLRLFNRWLPDFFIDDHVSDGADYQYDITYWADVGPELGADQAAWMKTSLLPYIDKYASDHGHLAGPYMSFVDDRDISKGLALEQVPPRFADAYVRTQNRPALTIEMHMIKDYKTRVTGNYVALAAMIEVINRDADKLTAMNRAADEAVVAAGRTYDPTPHFPLRLEPTVSTEPLLFKGNKYTRDLSAISGSMMVHYSKDPMEITIPRQNELKVTYSIALPRAYIVPAQWTPVIDILEAHGLKLQRTTRPWESEVDVYRCQPPQWQARPFEGHHVATWPDFKPSDPPCKLAREKMSFPAGSVVVPLDQRAAKIAVNLLEPEALDSLLQWGFFDTIFEQKEYGESYVLEQLARDMMARDPKLKEEFEQKVATDPQFAANSYGRLNWFFQHSPWWDKEQNRYPVGRLTSLDGVPLQ